jgi:hypothetical protein
MPGKLIETYQVRVYMNARELGLSQAEAGVHPSLASLNLRIAR